MAKQYGLDTLVDFAAANLMSFGKSFSRLNGQPLDKSEVWYNDLDALKAYALTDAAYVGQKVVYVDTTANTVTHYSIELNGGLKELGTAPIGDDKSISVDGEGVISLKNFGVEYYRLLDAEEEGYVEGEATYILQIVDETHPWKSGLVPRVLDGSIAWYEPSNVTVEGLNDMVGSLQTAVDANEQAINTLEGRIDTAEGDIDSLEGRMDAVEHAVSDNKAAYDEYVAVRTYTDSDIDSKVAGAFHFKGEATLETNDEGTWTGNLIKDETVIATPAEGDVYQVGEEEYVYDGTEWVKLGFTLDLSGYATKIELNSAKSELQSNIDSKVAQSDYNTKIGELEDTDEALVAKDTELEGKINGLTTIIDSINNADTGILKTAKDYADSEIQKLNVSQYATVESLNTTNEAVAANAADIEENKSLIQAVTATANNAATKTVVDALDARLQTAEAGVSTNAGNIATNTNNINTIKAEQETQNTAIEKNKTDLAALVQTVNTATTDLSTLTGRVDSVEGTANQTVSDLSALTTRVSSVEGTVEGHTTSINKNSADIAANTSLIEGLTGRVSTAEGEIDTLQSDVSTAKSDINTLKTLVGVAAEGDAEATGLHKSIKDLTEVVNTKANAFDVYTIAQTNTKINEAIAAANHLKREIVTELPAVEDADANTIYMILDSSVTGADKYNEWMLIGSAFAKIGDTTVDLANYVQKDDSDYTTALSDITALKAVGAQANVIESVKVNGSVLDVVDKSVNIGIATEETFGVVLSSTDENKVTVVSDGTMEVASVNVNKLVQTSGDYLILNGGTASK